MTTSIDCAGLGGLGREKHSPPVVRPCFSASSAVGVGSGCTKWQPRSGRQSRPSRGPLRRRRRGARAQWCAPFRTRHDSPRYSAGYRTRPKSGASPRSWERGDAHEFKAETRRQAGHHLFPETGCLPHRLFSWSMRQRSPASRPAVVLAPACALMRLSALTPRFALARCNV